MLHKFWNDEEGWLVVILNNSQVQYKTDYVYENTSKYKVIPALSRNLYFQKLETFVRFTRKDYFKNLKPLTSRMKKYIITAIVVCMIGVFIYLGFSLLEYMTFQKHTERVTSEKDKDITLINISELDRYEIAKAIDIIQLGKPKVLLLDICFLEDKGPKDSLLINTLCKYDNIILAYEHNSFQYEPCTHQKFSQCVSDSGYNNFRSDVHGVRWFIPKIDSYTHIALTAAKLYDPSTDLTKIKNGQELDILYSRTLDSFLYDLIEISFLMDEGSIIDSQLIRDKIVIFGYAGPSDEDKYKTPFSNYYGTSKGKPDTYGCVIIANIIRQVLDDY